MFGDLVRAHRRRLGMTQEELADRASVSVRSVGNWEGGRIGAPRTPTVRLLADAFGLTGADRERFFQSVADEAAEERTEDVTPAQLPSDLAGFSGRDDELARLDALLSGTSGETARAVVISAVSGTAGIGKTALAVHWAHRVAKEFPDGQLYVNLRGFDPTGAVMDPADAVRGFLHALQVDPQRVPATLDDQATLYRSLLSGRRVLIVLDNARDSDHVRHLLPGAPSCLVVVTSRNRLTGLVATHGAQPIALDLLSEDAACALLVQRLGPARIEAEPEAVRQLVGACARLPLALTVAAARAHLTGFALATLAAELRDAGQRLDALDTGDPASQVRAVFSWSYTALSPPAARLFRLLGLHPGPDISAAAAASLIGESLPTTRRLLTELVGANLVTEHVSGRHSFHDLLRVYAAEQAQVIDSDEQRRAATVRLLDYYLHTGYTADRLLNPTLDPITLAPAQPGVTPQHPADYQQVLDWFTAEHLVLLAAVEHAAAGGFDTHAWQLTWTLWTFLYRRGHWHDLAATAQAAVAAARRLGDPTARARAHRILAHAYTLLDRLDDADTELRHALDLATQAGDQVGQAHSHLSLAHLAGKRGNHDQAIEDARCALDHAQQALDLYEAAGHRAGQARALNAVGWYHAPLGEHQEAINACQRALALHQDMGDRDGQANTWDSLGYAHHHLGQHLQAVTCYQHALALYRDLGNRFHQAGVLTHIGDAQHSAGSRNAARDAWQQALSILDDLDHPSAQEVRTKLEGLNTPRLRRVV